MSFFLLKNKCLWLPFYGEEWKWMKYVSNHVTKFEKHGDLEKPYKDERIRK